MVERVGILVVGYGSRSAAMIDSFLSSKNYDAEIYVADKQRNPFNHEHAEKHVVIPDLDIEKICEFASKWKERIDFGIIGPEGPIIKGIRDGIERVGIPLICPTRAFALEGSKVAQRYLLEECCPDANPRFKVFDPGDYSSISGVKESVWAWLDELDNQAVVKPDSPAAGKGVGVWDDHFHTREGLFDHFLSNYREGNVIIEEKVEGEESSFQAFCDGVHLEVLPETRDYKRAFDYDKGPNTGGMGSYKDKGDLLPFMNRDDKDEEINVINGIFKKLGKDDGLRGIPFYVAFVHTAEGRKILEINSRPGDPEIQNLLPILKDDFVDLCFDLINRSLKRVEFEDKATVVTYAVPMEYGGYRERYSGDRKVDLSKAYKLSGDNLKIYPGSMELRGKEIYMLSSRTVCAVGIGDDIETAREYSLCGIRNIDGALWNRWDVGSREHIARSIEHMEDLRRREL
jgi:phosphoribosylamine--glycine ligase